MGGRGWRGRWRGFLWSKLCLGGGDGRGGLGELGRGLERRGGCRFVGRSRSERGVLGCGIYILSACLAFGFGRGEGGGCT